MHGRFRELSILNASSGDQVRLRILNLSEVEGNEACATETLSDDERWRAGRMRFERDRSRFVAVRTALRETLGDALSMAPRNVMFRYGPHGKPALERGNVEFNVSHSQEIGIIAVAPGHRVGVDVECVSFRDGLAEYLLSRRELGELRTLPPNQQDGAFIAWWTRKEAYVKAIGHGLSFPLASFCVSFLPGATPQLFDAGREKPIQGWSLFGFEPTPGYVAAVVVEGEGWCWSSESDPAGCFPAASGRQNADVSNPPQTSSAGLR